MMKIPIAGAMISPTATLLIVDDDSQNRKLLEVLLQHEGYLTLSAANGEEALALIAQRAPDLILLDIMMPGMDGYQVASNLKANPATSNIPIIMVTAKIDRSARLTGLNAGVEEFLTKPFDAAELQLKVRNLLRLKEYGDFLQNHSLILEQQVQARTAALTAEIAERERAQEALRGYATRLRDLSHRLRTVEETERRAISRELHDRIGQELSALALILGSLGAKLPREALRAVHKPLQDMQGLLKSMVGNVRDVMAELRPPVLDDYGLFAALRQLLTEFAKRSGIAAELSGVDLQPRLPSLVETAMFRISQEALNNIAKHAQAKKVEISLYAASDRVVLDITDDGVGFDAGETPPDQQHWGLITMRERAEAVGIAFHLESAPGAGTRIALEAERAAT